MPSTVCPMPLLLKGLMVLVPAQTPDILLALADLRWRQQADWLTHCACSQCLLHAALPECCAGTRGVLLVLEIRYYPDGIWLLGHYSPQQPWCADVPSSSAGTQFVTMAPSKLPCQILSGESCIGAACDFIRYPSISSRVTERCVWSEEAKSAGVKAALNDARQGPPTSASTAPQSAFKATQGKGGTYNVEAMRSRQQVQHSHKLAYKRESSFETNISQQYDCGYCQRQEVRLSRRSMPSQQRKAEKEESTFAYRFTC